MKSTTKTEKINGGAEAAVPDETTARAAPAELAARTLSGDLRDAVMDLLRELRDPWHKLSQKQQEFFAGRVTAESERLIARVVEIIAAGEFPAIAVILEQLAFKPKGIEAKLAMNAIDRATRHQLVDAQGKPILIVIGDPAEFFGARGPAKIDQQMPELPLDSVPNGEAIGPLPVEPHLEARKAGKAHGLAGVRDKAARWPAGEYGHADYELEFSVGQNERAALLATALELGILAGRERIDASANPYRLGTDQYHQWFAGWSKAAPKVESVPDAPRRRGRPRIARGVRA